MKLNDNEKKNMSSKELIYYYNKKSRESAKSLGLVNAEVSVSIPYDEASMYTSV